MIRVPVLQLILGVLVCAAGAPVVADDPARLSFAPGEPVPEINALFEQKEGWIGGDGANSVALGKERRLWLFSDTWVGSVRGGKRVDATIVNNSLGLQEGGDSSKMRFIVRKDADKKAVAQFTPADGRGWFWLQAGTYTNKTLYLFLSQIEKTDKTGVFAFRPIGQSLGIVLNPDEEPTSWRLDQRKLPCTIFSPERELTFGAAVLQDGEYLYVYGTDEDVKPGGRERYLIVARVPISQVKDFAAWRFYDGESWNSDFRSARRMVKGMASECSVSYLPDMKQYVLVYTDGGLSDRILVRTAPKPTGPWSDSKVVYRCQEASWDKKIFCYGAKAHPTLATGNELIICYFANSFDFWQVAADARLYFPRFIRVKFREQ